MKFLLLALPLCAQPAPQAKQSSWAFVGTQFEASTHPQPSGIVALALPLGGDTWSWSMERWYLSAGRLVSEATTGLAKRLWSFTIGRMIIDIVGLATAGVASAGNSVTGAFTGGGGAAFRNLLPKWLVLDTPFVGALQTKTGPQVILSLGKSW